VVVVQEALGDDQGGTLHTEGDLRMLCYYRGRDRTFDRWASRPRQAASRSALPGDAEPFASTDVLDAVGDLLPSTVE
jgi:hypothetical protein